jgi:hypothetical protein
MVRKYPVKKVSSAPATGRVFYKFLMKNIGVPAAANHNIWYSGCKEQLSRPDEFAFRGDIPEGKTLDLVALGGNPCDSPYTFSGEEAYVLVSDLSDCARKEMGIPDNARDKDKVFNSNYKDYGDLPQLTRVSNELAVLSVPKSISSYLAGVNAKVNYSERDVLDLLGASFNDLSGPEMMHFLHGNHLAWAALAFMREEGNVSGDLLAEFHGQNPTDFYTKDLGTVLPAMFFALASLGQDPVEYHNKLDVEIWGAKDAAKYMRRYLPEGKVEWTA